MGIEGNPPTALVQVTVQADWTDVVAEVLRQNSIGTFWISCYKRGFPSVHGSAKVSAVDERKVELTGLDGIELEAITNNSFKIKVPEYEGVEVEVYGTGRRTAIAKVSCLDVSPEGALFVAGSEDGILRIGETETGRMTHHRTMELLNSSGTTIRTLAQHDDRVNAIALDTWETPLTSKFPMDTREVGTEGKLVIAASENGSLYGLDVRASEEAFQRRSYNRSPLRACAFSARSSLIATGTTEGVVEIFDIRKTDQVLNRFQRGSAGISSLVFSAGIDAAEQGPHLIVGGDDSGLYETKSVKGPTIELEREYVGYDLDGPAQARLVAGGPGLVAISKEGGLLRFS
ncbi:hypothetical protein BGZ58_008951, partial [Dissophora ornata]